MTVITKPITEKKFDKLDQPLVAANCLPKEDLETGHVKRNSRPPQNLRYLVRVTRLDTKFNSTFTTACLLLLALLTLCFGVLGGSYLYKQFTQSHMNRLRGWCRVPYDDANALYSVAQRSSAEFQDLRFKADSVFLNEEVDIDDDSEKITVPDFDGGRSSRFIHDFNANKTGIVDVEGRRCFVMPLNRSEVLPPNDLIDLVRKMWAGYYDVDTQTVRKTMRVVIPPITEANSVGAYIQKECAKFPIYKLEEYVSGVFKRSIPEEHGVYFTHFAGKINEKLMIVNEDEVKAFEHGQSQS